MAGTFIQCGKVNIKLKNHKLREVKKNVLVNNLEKVTASLPCVWFKSVRFLQRDFPKFVWKTQQAVVSPLEWNTF